MRPIRFVHLTDLHIAHPDLGSGVPLTDTTATLKTVVGMILAIEPAPEFVLVSGDLTERGDEASFRLVRELLAPLPMPVLCALGNHDTRPGFYAGMAEPPIDATAPCCHDAAVAGAHVIVLDSSVAGRIGGVLDEAQFAFLTSALLRHPELPRLVVLHHAPALGDDQGHPWERLGDADSRRLRECLQGHRVAGIFCGHVHCDRVSLWHGIPLVIATGLHNANDILQPRGLRFVTGASFALCTLRDSGLTVSFVPLPSERRELAVLAEEVVKTFV